MTERKARPTDWPKAEYSTGWEELVQTLGTVVAFETTGSYEGDHEVLLQDSAGRWGIVVIGFGSCSGCDALQAATPWDEDEGDWSEVIDLLAEVAADVTWHETPSDAVAWIDAKLQPGEWWAHDTEVTEVMRGFRERIMPTIFIDDRGRIES